MCVNLVADFTFTKELKVSILPLVKDLIASSPSEQGCLRYEAFIKPEGIIIIEAWESDKDLEKHKQAKPFMELVSFVEKNNVTLVITEVQPI